MHVTQYHNWTDDELLAYAEKGIPHSPLITELVRRLEKAPFGQHTKECPCCEATLHVEYGDGQFTLEKEL